MPVDLATLTREQFEAQRGTTFLMRLDPERTLALELVEIEAMSTRPGAPRAAFLLRFRAGDNTLAPQHIYLLEHPVLGGLEIFLVPSGPDAVGMRYDAIFS